MLLCRQPIGLPCLADFRNDETLDKARGASCAPTGRSRAESRGAGVLGGREPLPRSAAERQNCLVSYDGRRSEPARERASCLATTRTVLSLFGTSCAP